MCLLKAVRFAFDFVGEWRPTIQKKATTVLLYNNFNDTQTNLMTWLRFSSILKEPSRVSEVMTLNIRYNANDCK